ncbi:MAG: hypothetical protein JJ969_15875 [Rhizobiaceae bacterium]|nr:hypothetical protein [Rhizobiaceae bacterium]
MEKFRQVANMCVGRAVMFGWLAIGLIMLSFSFNPAIAFRAGAVMALGMATILIVKAFEASRKNPRHTEAWLYLDDKSRPANPDAKRVFRNTLREVYGRFAQGVFLLACVMFVLSMIFVGLGYDKNLPILQRVDTRAQPQVLRYDPAPALVRLQSRTPSLYP